MARLVKFYLFCESGATSHELNNEQILGPRGLMPNPKLGTVTKDVENAVRNAKAGEVQFRVDPGGNIHVKVGNLSFANTQLLDNIKSVMVAVSDAKPESYKGVYLKSASISSTIGPGVPLELPSVDPHNARFMVHSSSLKSKSSNK